MPRNPLELGTQFDGTPASEEATGNPCLGSKAAVQERVGNFLAGLASRKDEVRRRCRTGPAVKGRSTPPKLPARFPASGKSTSHLGLGLETQDGTSDAHEATIRRKNRNL